MSDPARASWSPRAHADDENGSCSWALPRALRRLDSLRTPFYRSASTALVPVPWSSVPSPSPPLPHISQLRVPFSFLSPSVPRVRISTVLLRLRSILFFFFLAPISRAPCRRPSSCTVTRMHARTPRPGRAPKRTTGLVTCSLADSQRSYGHRRHLA